MTHSIIFFFHNIFQSTHPRRVRQRHRSNGGSIEYFNPRTREGCDSLGCKHASRASNFNPRTREGCDDVYKFSTSLLGDFNPRTREGCDTSTRRLSKAGLFQSTHPRRVRLSFQLKIRLPLTFQSTHPRRVRRNSFLRRTQEISNFNPRTREGCDVLNVMTFINLLNFNPRTREGCDNLMEA